MQEPALHPLRYRGFRAFFVAQAMLAPTSFGATMVIAWQGYEIARRTMPVDDSALVLAAIGAVQFLALALLSPLAGIVSDRADRRRVVLGATLLQTICIALLAWTTIAGTVDLAWLLSVSAGLGAARAFLMPAEQALNSNLVPPGALPTAIALGSIPSQFGMIGGPVAAGLLYAVKPWLPYVTGLPMMAVGILALALIGPTTQERAAADDPPLRQMAEGFRYVRRNRIVLGAISLDLFAVLAAGVTAMLPIYARDVLDAGSVGLGLLRAAPAVGAGVVGLILSVRPLRRSVGHTLLFSVAVFGLATCIFGLSRSLPLAAAALAVAGGADMVSIYVRNALVQLSTPNSMRGRVAAISSLFISGSNELGEAESGLLAALVGPVAAVVAGGAVAITVTVLWARVFPSLRRADTFADVEVVA